MPKRKDIETSTLIKQYDDGFSLREIGDKNNLSSAGVIYRLQQAGKVLRSNKEGQRLAIRKGRHNKGSKGKNNPNWRGGEHITTHGYRRVYKPEHPDAIDRYVLEHRLIWEETNKRSIPKGYVIHHFNGIRTDNRPENLFAISRKEHRAIEMGTIYKKRIRELEEMIDILKGEIDSNES